MSDISDEDVFRWMIEGRWNCSPIDWCEHADMMKNLNDHYERLNQMRSIHPWNGMSPSFHLLTFNVKV